MISLSDEMADTIEEQIGIYLSNNGVRTDFAELRAKLFGGVCYAALPNSFVIDPYGVIRKCTVNLKDDKNKVGQIIDGVNYSMNFYALADWTKTQITNSECVNCCIYPVCMKRGCIAGVVNGDNNCKVNKKAIFSYLQNLSKLAFSYQLNLDELGENDEQVVEME
jgi:radical SAM protein with 4Fe4S-binding SPASM domain